MSDPLVIAGHQFGSRLFLGTAGYPNRKLMLDAINASGTAMVTASIRRISLAGDDESLVDLLAGKVKFLPNTAGCQTAKDAVLTRNIHREFVNRNPTDREEAQMAKWVSLIVKFGALVFIVFVPSQYAIYLQLLGGIWIIQTLPSVMLGVYTRWFNDWALLAGWVVGIGVGTWMFIDANLTPKYPLAVGGFTFPGYAALYTLILNLLVTVVLTLVLNAIRRPTPIDDTVAADYHA